MRNHALIAGLVAALMAGAAGARKLPPTGDPATLQSLLACRSITDSAQRLACYDKASGAFAEAVSKKEVVVIDKQRATEAKRSLFGFSVPNFAGLFGGGDDINQIEGTVAAAFENGYDGWTIKLADGSTWQQTDGTPLALEPRRGDKVVVKRGAMGSYFVKIGSQPGFKAKRIG
jgi:hypothetical protein